MRIVKVVISAEAVERNADTDLFDEIGRAQDADKLTIVEFNYDAGFRVVSSAFPENEAGKARIAMLQRFAGDGLAVEDVTSRYLFATTTAPKVYDGFGTLTVEFTDDRTRLVAILREHKDWQINRYRSGVFETNVQSDR